MNILKKHRLLAGLTQAEIAQKIGISKEGYQNWESGEIKVPSLKLKKIALLFGVTVNEMLSKPKPFDYAKVYDEIEDARTYFGEVAIHFSNNRPLLLPISEAEHDCLFDQLQGENKFVIVESLDNRIVLIRKTAVTDIFFSSDEFGDYGPEPYEGYIGIYPDDRFWEIVECLEIIGDSDTNYSQKEIDDAIKSVCLTEDKIDSLIARNKIPAEDREMVINEQKVREELFSNRAKFVSWQLSSGKIRSVYVDENREIYDLVYLMENNLGDLDEMIYISAEGRHRSIFINKRELDYLSVPAHKFREGSLECIEEMVDA